MTINTPKYSSSSVYYTTPFDSQGNLSYWTPRPIPALNSDKIVTISETYNQRPDLMAHDMYGDSRLWWVYAQRNPNSLAADPLGNFISGLKIYIPDPNTVKTALGL